MAQDNYTDTDESQDESGDSEVLRSLRAQLKEKDKELRARPDRASLEAEIRTQLERESAIAEQLVALGHPKGLSEFVEGKLGDADVSRESVAQTLQSIGYQVEVEDAASEPASEPSADVDSLATVSNLSAQVRSAAQGGDLNDMMRKIEQANTPEDLAKLAAEGGFLNAG